jgi:very-short-patch-repair endonuclease
MNKLDYISRQFSKAENKRFEHYVVTRIWHLLNDLSIKFTTQQYVTRPDGRALTDMFFPQLELHIEIDEGHHKNQMEFDKLREADIINATGHEILRVDVTKNIETINHEISQIIERVKEKQKVSSNFKDWDINAEQNPLTYIDKGFIDLKDDCAFRTMVDAANCFGNNYKPKGIWKGGAKHTREIGKGIWFPKLYKNGEWNNSISNDETEIREISESPKTVESHIDDILRKGIYKRIVFARVKSPLGDIMYRFKGEYELDKQQTNYTDGLLWKRISERVNTYRFDL